MKAVFYNLTQAYCSENKQTELWTEIEQHYSNKKRHYHSLKHLETLYSSLLPLKETIENWEAILFALFYHDVIYNASKSNNEEKSAELAEKRLREIGVSETKIQLCFEAIIATKSHQFHQIEDINLFTDADLAILGFSAEAYQIYAQQIRKEYAIYPDLIYKPGRKKVLKHFLEMEKIYKTQCFFDLYETQARENIEKELDTL